ncbi:MAG TPA: amidohydrolase family protein [Acidimicrobiia bacterium]
MADATSPEGWAERWGQSAVARPSTLTVDVHTHILVPESAEMTRPHFTPEMDPRTFYSAPETKELNQRFYGLVQDKYTDPGTRLADMDALGIDIQLLGLSPFHYFYWADADLAPRVASVQNERIAEIARIDPRRFVGLGTLPMAHPAAAVEEAHRLAGEYGFPGVYLGADITGIDLDHEMFEPVWDALEELGLVAVLHPAGFTHAERLTDYYLVNVIGMPLSSTLAVTRMILAGVFERHPDLRMLVVHGGGYLTFYSARTDHAFRHRPELRHHIDRLPSEYLSRLYYDITVFDPGMIEHLVRAYGADHVLLGTDYPFDMGLPDPLALVAGASLTEEERDLVVGGSAVRLFGLEVE